MRVHVQLPVAHWGALHTHANCAHRTRTRLHLLLNLERNVMDPPAVTESGFGAYNTDTGYNNNFSEPTRLPYNRSAEQSAASESASVIIAISITAIYSAICVLGLLGNVLVMYGVIRYISLLLHSKQTKQQQNITCFKSETGE